MTRWDALKTIARCLRSHMIGGPFTLEPDVSWERIVEVASFHLMTPALGWCLAREGGVPQDVRDYFAEMTALNARRNELMLTGLARTGVLLNVIGIEPVLLKGAACVVEGLYPEPGLRVLGDVDILIPRARADAAVAALRAAGFVKKPSDVVPPPAHHHLPMLHDPDTGMGVELHTDVISRAADAVIATDWFCQSARPAVFRGARVLLPEPTRNIGHTIYHGEVFHEEFEANRVSLRSLLDVALIRARHEQAIDWGMLDRRFGDAGLGEVLATYLSFAEELFGEPAPALSHAPHAGALAALQETESHDGFAQQIDRLQDGRNKLQNELSRVLGEHEALVAEYRRLAAGHAALQAGYRTLEEHYRALGGSQRTLEGDYKSLEQHYLALNARHAALAERNTTLEHEHTATSRAKEAAEDELGRLKSSRSWRLTAPLRALTGATRRIKPRA